MDRLTLTPARAGESQSRKPSIRYEDDVTAWALEQAGLLRAKQWAKIDIDHLADEIEDMARSEAKALRSAIALVLQHLLKWDHQPEQRSRSWSLSVRVHRRRVRRLLDESPSLRSRLAEFADQSYEDARDAALAETGLPEEALPARCPYGWDEIMARPSEWPEQP